LYWLPIYYAVHSPEDSGFDKAAACVRVAGETDSLDAAPKAERKTVFPRGS